MNDNDVRSLDQRQPHALVSVHGTPHHLLGRRTWQQGAYLITGSSLAVRNQDLDSRIAHVLLLRLHKVSMYQYMTAYAMSTRLARREEPPSLSGGSLTTLATPTRACLKVHWTGPLPPPQTDGGAVRPSRLPIGPPRGPGPYPTAPAPVLSLPDSSCGLAATPANHAGRCPDRHANGDREECSCACRCHAIVSWPG